MSGGDPRPGSFPAIVLAVKGQYILLQADAEDVAYLQASEGKSVDVDVTPVAAAGGDSGSAVSQP